MGKRGKTPNPLAPAVAPLVAVAPTFVLFTMDEVVGMTCCWSAKIAGKTLLDKVVVLVVTVEARA